MIIPRNIQIETINGVCTSRCIMCTYSTWTRKPMVMDSDTYRKILEKLSIYREHFQYLTLHGYGEPLLDKGLDKKVQISKELGFKGTGLATNCTELSENISFKLIKAGLDTIICSIDGINKETHEAIRVGTNFDKIVSNVKKFIEIRNKLGKTRVIVRFIRQEINKKEWSLFLDYWLKHLDKDFGDSVVKFDIHNRAGKLENYQSQDPNRNMDLDNYVCESVFERMLIYSNGKIALCDADDNGFYDLGNATHSDPIEIYNSKIFNYYRERMKEGKIHELTHCKNCTIPRSRFLKEKG